ncbi:hypothetical protein KC573_02490 [candidate division WWE3 bacterium]|uniref:SCP domain-containing protein n=1 Tax=candidate division WWE3 bacterium TaxID=2053526 RepID=A0A955LVT5_UNCKA|nr:hypothetical protein [candidate division WWE3 bacterium]
MIICIALLFTFIIIPERYLIPEQADVVVVPTSTPIKQSPKNNTKVQPITTIEKEEILGDVSLDKTIPEVEILPTVTFAPSPTPTKVSVPIPTNTPVSAPTLKISTLGLDADKLLAEINSWRSDLGLDPFTKSEGSCWIVKKRLPMVVAEFSHDGFESTIEQYVNLAGIQFWNGGENIAKGAKDEVGVVALWENSTGHRHLMAYDAPHACVAVDGDVAVLIVEFSIIEF